MVELKKHIWSEVDLDAIENNVSAFRGIVKNSEIIAVIKANAYGHGAPKIAAFLEGIGINMFAVASV